MRKPTVETLVLASLVVVALGNAGLSIEARNRLGEARRAVTPIQRTGVVVDHPAGFTAMAKDGRQLQPSSTARVWAIRYVSKYCGFCESDKYGKGLMASLRQAGADVIDLVPREGEEGVGGQGISYPATELQATFVPMEWVKRFRLTATPTYLVFDREGTLIWHHQGTLGPGDSADALRRVNGQ